MTISKQMKRIYVLRDTLRDNETVFEGDAKACAKFCHTSMQNVGQCFKRGGKLNRRYAIEIVRLVHIELTHQYRGGSQKARQSIIDAITMQDVAKIRNSVQVGTAVNIFRKIESADEKQLVGSFPISEKHRHIFTVQMKGYKQSYTWVDLLRKDGVELDSKN